MMNFKNPIQVDLDSELALALRYEVVSSMITFQPLALRFDLYSELFSRTVNLPEAAKATNSEFDSRRLSMLVIEKAALGFRLVKRHYPELQTYVVPVLMQDLAAADYRQDLLDMFRQLNLAAGELTLSISERDPSLDLSETARNMQRLLAAGVRIDLNRFGSGLTGMHYLLNLPVSSLTLDAGLIKRLPEASARHLIRMIVDSARAMKVQVIASGLSQVAWHDLLTSAGCELASGSSLPMIEQRFNSSDAHGVTKSGTVPILKAC